MENCLVYEGQNSARDGIAKRRLGELYHAKLPVGTDSITAIYGGDSNFDASTSNVVAQVVEKAGT